MAQEIKICGLRSRDALEAALDGGADLVGFVRFPPSPRHISLDEAIPLSDTARGRALRTVLLVDPDDAEIAAVVEALDPDLLQLHGNESPARVAEIRAATGRPVMKALGIAESVDLAQVSGYRGVADRLLLDAKAPPGAAHPGGNGLAFDWGLLSPLGTTPYMLSGGLSPDNVADAILSTGTSAVDVSSGVEIRPGEKDPARIEAFIRAARAAFTAASIRDKVA